MGDVKYLITKGRPHKRTFLRVVGNHTVILRTLPLHVVNTECTDIEKYITYYVKIKRKCGN